MSELAEQLKNERIETMNTATEPLRTIYWRVRNETQDKINQAITDGNHTPDDLMMMLNDLNKIAPIWLSHSLNKGDIKHAISSEKLLKVIKDTTPILFTERYPDGIEYIGTHWREIKKIAHAKELIKSAVVDELQTLNLYDRIKPQDFRKHVDFVTLGMMKYKPITFGNNALVNFKNGTVNIQTGVIHPHDQDDYLTELLPVDYTDSTDGGLVYDYAKHLLGDEVQTLSEWFGYMFINDMATMNHIVFMQGVGGNGKSTLLIVLAEAFGQYASGHSLAVLSGGSSDRYLSDLHGKRANIIAESDPYISPDGLTILKKLTGGDFISANPKGKDPFTFTNRAKFIVSANFNLPDVENEPEFRRRFVLLNAGAPAIETMDNPLAFKEKYSKDKMIADLPKFIGYSIRQAQKAMQAKALTILPSTKARTDDWLGSSDLVQKFVDSFIVPTHGNFGVTRNYLLKAFNEFLKDELGEEMSTPEFIKSMARKGVKFEPLPTKGHSIDAEVVDDHHLNKRNRAKGKGYKA